MQNNLELVSTEDLMNELVKRNDHIIITSMKIVDGQGQYITLRRWQGNGFVCLGLMDLMKDLICKAELSRTTPMVENKDR